MKDETLGVSTGKILAVDDNPAALEALASFLEGAGFEVLTAISGREALRVAREPTPDLVLLKLGMAGMSGYEVLRRLKAFEETSDAPVVIVTAPDQAAEKEKAIYEGADDFLATPFEQRELLVRIRILLKVKRLHEDLDRTLKHLHELEAARYAGSAAVDTQNSPTPYTPLARILIVEDELLERAIYADLLKDHGYEVLTAPTAAQALEFLRLQAIDVILVDLVLPGMSGPALIERLKTVSPETPVIVVTAHPSSHHAITALKLGAFDFIVKGFKNEVMLHAVRRAVEKRRLEQQSETVIQEIRTKVDRLLGQA